MTEHTCTEKIGGDSIDFCGLPSRAGNCYDSLATPLGIAFRKSDQYFCHMLYSFVIRMLSLSFVSTCVVIMHIFLCDLFTVFSYYVSIMWCYLWFGL